MHRAPRLVRSGWRVRLALVSTATCPRCDAPRVDGPDCPRCGVIYARAEARARREQEANESAAAAGPPAFVFADPERPPHLPAESPIWDGEAEEELLERRLRLVVPPLALALAFAFVTTGAGAFVARLTSGMWLHELGHAASAWLCGYSAVPLPWFTSIAREKSVVVALLFVALWSYLAYRAHRTGARARAGVFGTLALLHVLFATVLSRSQAQAFITFGGDAGGLVFAAGLMATFFSAPGSRLHQGALRWGFLALGAVGYADIFMSWVRARLDPGEIPFGRIEGVGLSDATKLVDLHGMTPRGMVNAFLAVGVIAIAAFGVAYVFAAVLPALRARRVDMRAGR